MEEIMYKILLKESRVENLVEWLNEAYQFTQEGYEQNRLMYEGALTMLTYMNIDWERDSEGVHHLWLDQEGDEE